MPTNHADGSSAHPQHSRPVRRWPSSRTRQHRRTILIRSGVAIAGLSVLCGAVAVVLAHQVSNVRNDLEQAVDFIPQLRNELEEGNTEAAQQSFNVMQQQISAARSTSTGPLWKVASIIPFAGPNFGAVSEVVVSIDDVSTQAIAPMLEKYDSLDWQTLSPTDGRIDVAQLHEAAPTISAAANTARLSYERLDAIDHSNLLPQVANPVQSVTTQLQGVTNALDAASSAARLLPAMLGTDEPRKYLVLVQNNAEARATGGIPGALAMIDVVDGRISMGEQSSASALGSFNPPLDVDPEQVALYTARLGAQMQNVNLTPDFPTAALTAKRMWEERHSGQQVDGVIGLDPVVLSHLLKATGPVVLTDPEVLGLAKETSLPEALTNENVVPTLLSDVYREIANPALQDLYFAAVAGEVFTAFTTSQGDKGQLIDALISSVQERRLYLWSAKTNEQHIVATTALAGSVDDAESGGTTFGVYINDGTGAKMDYYAQRTFQLLQTCQSNGYSTYTVRMLIANTAPLDAASTLPAYVTGGGVFGVDPGRIRTNYVVYGPAQAFAETATVNGSPVPIGSGKHGQRPVGTVSIELGPGETSEIEVVFSRVVQESDARLQVTPGLESLEKVVLPTRQISCN